MYQTLCSVLGIEKNEFDPVLVLIDSSLMSEKDKYK